MKNGKKIRTIIYFAFALCFVSFLGIFVGSSSMSFVDCIKALLKISTLANNRIVWGIRIPRVIAAIIAGAGLSISGLVMQTNLNNPMASPSTLGVSNAAVFGANLSIIFFAGGYLNSGHNVNNYTSGANPFATSIIAFIFAALSILVILALCKVKDFLPGVVVLAGIAIGSVWTAATTILQFYATDVGLSAAVIWNFGDLGRATYKTDLIMFIVVSAGLVVFSMLSWKFNALLSGDQIAKSMGLNVERIRFLSMLFSSVITAVCVSFLGIIGFVGIICPHIIKHLIGQDHRYTIPASALCGSTLLVCADAFSRSFGGGSALPVGAITSLLGAPFFIAIIFSGRTRHHD